MGLDPQEGFTEGDKTGDVQDRIWRELVKLHAVNKENPMKKFVGRKRKTTEKESKKHHPITTRGLGDAFGTREDDLLTSDEEPFPLSLGQIGLFEFRGHLAGHRAPALLLRHLLFVRNSIYGHSEEVCSGAARKLRSARKMKQWWRQKNKGLVNIKNQSLALIKLPVKGTWAEMWRMKRKQ
jgi:hypothetical protein